MHFQVLSFNYFLNSLGTLTYSQPNILKCETLQLIFVHVSCGILLFTFLVEDLFKT
jgi:hypothetical protein